MKTLLFSALVASAAALHGAAGIGTGPSDEIIALPRASLVRPAAASTTTARAPGLAGSSLSRDAAIDLASILAEQIGGSIAVVANSPGARMAPALPPDSILVLKPVALEQLRPGDVITFERSSGVGVARVLTSNVAGARVCADQSSAVEIIGAASIRKRVVAVLFCRSE